MRARGGFATLPGMTRFLFASMPAAGHIGPLVPLAFELVARGHSIAWYTGDAYRDKVEATGATFYPHVHAPDRDVSELDAEFPERAKLKGVAKFKFDMREVFIAAVPGQVADLEAMLDDVRPDIIVAEPGMAAAARVIEQRHGIPWATCNISAFAMRSIDSAPFGLGLKPMTSRLGRLRNRVLNALIYRTLYRSIDRDYHAMLDTLGMEGADGGLFDETLSPYLYLQPTVPSFEYPRGDLAPQVHFVGPLLPPVPADFAVPAWWDEMLADPRPVVLVTQGTVATDPHERRLRRPALRARPRRAARRGRRQRGEARARRARELERRRRRHADQAARPPRAARGRAQGAGRARLSGPRRDHAGGDGRPWRRAPRGRPARAGRGPQARRAVRIRLTNTLSRPRA